MKYVEVEGKLYSQTELTEEQIENEIATLEGKAEYLRGFLTVEEVITEEEVETIIEENSDKQY